MTFVPTPDDLRSALDPVADALEALNVIHLASMMKVDVFVLKTRDFDRQAFARATKRQVGDAPARHFPMTSAEDIVLHKLEWYRLGNEIAQRAHLERWSRELGVEDLLLRALADAGLD